MQRPEHVAAHSIEVLQEQTPEHRREASWQEPRDCTLPRINHSGPPGAIGEKFTVSQYGHEDVSHEQSLLYVEKQRVVPYGISRTYGRTAILRRPIGIRARDPDPS